VRVGKRDQIRLFLLNEQARRAEGIAPVRGVAPGVATGLQSQGNKRRRQGTIGGPSSSASTTQQKEQAMRPPGRPKWNEGQASTTQPIVSAVFSNMALGSEGGEEGPSGEGMDTSQE